MTLLPRRHVVLETPVAPGAVLAGVAPAVELVNRAALLVQLRSEVDGSRVWVGWWPAMAFTRGGIRFEGTVEARDGGAVLTGEIGYFPPAFARWMAAILVVATLLPAAALCAQGAWKEGLLGSVWLGGGGRFALGFAFHRHAERVERALRVATSDGAANAAGA